MSSKARKSWREKLDNSNGLPKVEEISGPMSKKWGNGTIVIPAPIEVDTLMRSVPHGKLTTVNKIREALARKHGATIACPTCAGIFAQISAHAAEEAKAEGKEDTTPYWRTLKSTGELNEKYPGGIAAQAARLEQEGHTIEVARRGKTSRVQDFDRSLADLQIT